MTFSNFKYSLFIITPMLFAQASLASSSEQERFVAIKDLYGKYHYTNVFAPDEQSEIAEALQVLKANKEAVRRLESNLKCFSNKEECHKFSVADILSLDKNFQILKSNTPRNAKAAHNIFKRWFFHVALSTPTSSYPSANVLRAPFSRWLTEICEQQGLSNIKISRQGVVPLYAYEELISHVSNHEDFSVYSFLVVADFEKMTPHVTREQELCEHPSRLAIASQLETLITSSGFTDISVNNVGLESADGKLVLFDTEPLMGEMMIVPAEFQRLGKLEGHYHDYYGTTIQTLAELSSLTKVTSLLKSGSQAGEPGMKKIKSFTAYE